MNTTIDKKNEHLDIQRFLDHEYPPNEEAAAEKHLQSCPRCRQCLDQYVTLFQKIDGHFAPPPLSPDSSRTEDIMRKIEAPPGFLEYFQWFLAQNHSLMTGAAVAGVLGTVLLFSLFSRPSHPPTLSPVPVPSAKDTTYSYVFSGTNGSHFRGTDTKDPMPNLGNLHSDTIYETPPNGVLTVEFSGTNLIDVGSSTKFRIHPRGIFLFEGRVTCSLGHRETGYQVETPNACLTTIGTEFDVSFRNGETTGRLVRGKIQLTSGERSRVLAAPAEFRVIRRGEILTARETLEKTENASISGGLPSPVPTTENASDSSDSLLAIPPQASSSFKENE